MFPVLKSMLGKAILDVSDTLRPVQVRTQLTRINHICDRSAADRPWSVDNAK